MTLYYVIHHHNDSNSLLASDGNFYSAYISMKGCNTLVYKKLQWAEKKAKKFQGAVVKRTH